MKTPFFAPDAFRRDDPELRAYRPDDGEALREATLSSYERLRVASVRAAEKRGMVREATFRSRGSMWRGGGAMSTSTRS